MKKFVLSVICVLCVISVCAYPINSARVQKLTLPYWGAIEKLFLHRAATSETQYKEALTNCLEMKNTYENSFSGAATSALAQYLWTDEQLSTKTDEEINQAIVILNNGAAIAAAHQDATAFVTNANLSETALVNDAPAGWNLSIKSVEGEGDIWIREQYGENVYNIWYPYINDLEVTQIVANLPNGTYRFSVELGTDFSGDAADMLAFIAGERVGASEQVHTYNTDASRNFDIYTCAATTTNNSVSIGVRSLKNYFQMKNVHLQFICDTPAEQETDASYLRHDYFWNGRDATYVDLTTDNFINLYGQAIGVHLYPRNKNQDFYAYSNMQFNSTQDNVVANGQCLNLVLTDGEALEMPRTFRAINATYSREMESQWGSVLLPYSLKSDNFVQFYTLASVDQTSMHFIPVSNVPANTPAIFRRLFEHETSVTLSGSSLAVETTANATVATDCDGWSLMGSYIFETIHNADAFYLADDLFLKSSGTITIHPFCAYFITTDSQQPQQLNIVIDDQPTSIEESTMNKAQKTDTYNLQGQKVQHPSQGLYIINGKKVYIK